MDRPHLPRLLVARSLIVAGLALIGAAPVLQGQTYWTNPGTDGVWSNTANWSNGLPKIDPINALAGTDGIINNGGRAVVNSASNARSVIVGETATGALAISANTLSTRSGGIGLLAGSAGTVTVAFGATWSSSASITVAHGGTGEINVASGGRVTTPETSIGYNAGSVGTAVIAGTWAGGLSPFSPSSMFLGRAGSGTLSIVSGGLLMNTHAEIGIAATGVGSAEVAGRWLSTNMSVGVSGSGLLSVAAGGEVTVGNGSGTMLLATDSGSTGTLRIGTGAAAGTVKAGQISGGSGSAQVVFDHTSETLTFAPKLTGSVNVQHEGAGTTVLTDANDYTGGTTVLAGTLRAGNASALPTNTAYRVDGGTLELNGHALTMSALSGDGGTVALGGAALTVAQSTSTAFGGGITGSGSVRLNGSGTLVLGGSSSIDGPMSVEAGTLVVEGLLASTEVIVADGATLGGSGTIEGNTVIAGTLAPGNAIGTLTFLDGLVLESTARLHLQIASGAEFDQLVVEGALSYGGELWISFLDDYRPLADESFSLIHAASFADGTFFSDVRFDVDGYTAFFDHETGALTLTLTAIPEPATVAAFAGALALGLAVVVKRRRARTIRA